MITTQRGLHFIAMREADVLVPYKDGDGYSQGLGRYGVSPDAPEISIEKSFEWFLEDIAERETQLNALLKPTGYDSDFLRSWEWDALMSVLYNAGAGNLRKSAVIPLLANSRFGRAAEALLSVKAPTPGLYGRRLMERDMFLNASYGELGKIKLYNVAPVKGQNTPYEWIDFPTLET